MSSDVKFRPSEIRYDDGQVASFLYDGTGDLIKMEDWNGTTSISMDLLDRIVSVTDHKDRTVEYGWDAVGNKTSQGYPDGSQVDYWYDAENRIVQVQDFDDGVTLFEYDPNGNKIYKEYPNNETAWYSYDVCDQIIELDEYDLGGKKLFKTTYSWDAEGNRLSEMQYNHGQSGSKKENASVLDNVLSIFGLGAEEPETPTVELSTPDLDATSAAQPIVNPVQLPDPTTDTAAGVFLEAANENIEIINQQLLVAPEEEAGAAEPETESEKPETGKDDATIEGNGDGNGQVPPGQHEDEDGTIVNPGGNVAPGLNRGKKIDKPANPNKPEKPNKPGSEDKEDKKVNKAQQGTHIYTYDELNRMVTSDVSKVFTNYTYDTLGNLVLETVKNKSVDYEYNELNQLVKRTTTENETFTYSYDKRGNRVAETGKKESREYVYDATNRLVEGTNWKGDKSAYTYNGLGLRVNNLVTTHAGKTYDRDYVIDYTSPENDDLYVYAMGNGQLEYEQRHVYAGSERLEQITEKGIGGWERTLYVHEDVMGNTRYYTKATGQNFAELQYDAWGQPVSPNKLVNNDHGNYVFATFTGHIYDTTLDVYFAEARFYDATTRTWMAMDPIKDALNWYQYCLSNPTTRFDITGLMSTEELEWIKWAYMSNKLTADEAAKVILLREMLGNTIHADTIADDITNRTKVGLETDIDDMYAKMRSENNISKNALSQNINLAFHEIAQITAGKQLAQGGFYQVEVREEGTRYENDIVVHGIDLYEVKPLWTLAANTKRGEAQDQLDRYIRNSKNPIKIGTVPEDFEKKSEEVYLFTLGDMKVYEKYAGTALADLVWPDVKNGKNVPGKNVPGMVGYYLTLGYEEDRNQEKQVEAKPSRYAQRAAQHFNNVYYSYQIQQNQQKTFEVQLSLSLSAIMFQLQIFNLSATVFPAWYQMGTRTPGSLLQHNLIYFQQYTACGLMNAA